MDKKEIKVININNGKEEIVTPLSFATHNISAQAVITYFIEYFDSDFCTDFFLDHKARYKKDNPPEEIPILDPKKDKILMTYICSLMQCALYSAAFISFNFMCDMTVNPELKERFQKKYCEVKTND